MIGTFLVIWLGAVPAIWLVWALSRVPALFATLTARVRKVTPYSQERPQDLRKSRMV